jgi:hypothetical protein
MVIPDVQIVMRERDTENPGMASCDPSPNRFGQLLTDPRLVIPFLHSVAPNLSKVRRNSEALEPTPYDWRAP